jgi:protein phosphatase
VPERFIAITDKGMRRATNQDSAIARELPSGLAILVVADGVGGSGGGEVASKETVETIVAALSEDDLADPPFALKRAVARANDRVRALSRSSPELAAMATTLVVALVEGHLGWIVSVGDSRAYLWKSGEMRMLTEDDSWVAEQVRSGVLTEQDAARSPYQNVITRGIGVEDSVRTDVIDLELESGDTLLLCSDGLYRAVSAELIGETVKDRELKEAAAKLVELANGAGGPDNISVVLYRDSW